MALDRDTAHRSMMEPARSFFRPLNRRRGDAAGEASSSMTPGHHAIWARQALPILGCSSAQRRLDHDAAASTCAHSKGFCCTRDSDGRYIGGGFSGVSPDPATRNPSTSLSVHIAGPSRSDGLLVTVIGSRHGLSGTTKELAGVLRVYVAAGINS